MTDYLTVADVEAIHDDQVRRYGGIGGLRSPGRLEAALARPWAGYLPDLIGEAAALWESLSRERPFNDANRRTAFASVQVFLAVNRVEITANPDAIFEFLSELQARNALDFESLDAWLRANTRTA